MNSDFHWTTGPEWRFCLTADFTICLGTGWPGYHEFYDNEKLWGVLRGDVLTIKSGYAWNGASPAWYLCGRWIGTPTPPSAMVPTLIHDLLFQFMDVRCAPWDRRQADNIFFNLMAQYRFRLKGTYHGAVAILGSLYRRISAKNPNAVCGFCQ